MTYILNSGIIIRSEPFGVIILKHENNKVFFVNKTGAFILNQIIHNKNKSLLSFIAKTFKKKTKKN